ncbi:hypothetical protein ILUMI_11409 [Ignelater luminosus]|uniref:Uncharacterized protein n=1 Tax=Ignelater luminosus TaxID=2038154 RepID=A0A8K0GCR0_IGNLU|nr:hypothetical protein ILUMI_11409 [Ignelater luminosus]
MSTTSKKCEGLSDVWRSNENEPTEDLENVLNARNKDDLGEDETNGHEIHPIDDVQQERTVEAETTGCTNTPRRVFVCRLLGEWVDRRNCLKEWALWTKEVNEDKSSLTEENKQNENKQEEEETTVDLIEMEELEQLLEKMKNRKVPRSDELNTELIKYASPNKKKEKRIKTAKMEFLRKTAKYTRRNSKRNAEIRRELQIQSINESLEEYKTQWTSYLDRMDYTYISKTFMYEPKGLRPLGRPKKRWHRRLEEASDVEWRIE